jgi:hypothetical protein
MPRARDWLDDDSGYERERDARQEKTRLIDVSCLGDPGPVFIEERYVETAMSPSVTYSYGRGAITPWYAVVHVDCEYCGTRAIVELKPGTDCRCGSCGAGLRITT